MEKIQQIKEKLDEALSRISLPLYHWHQPENFFTDMRTETRILIQEALALIDKMEKEKEKRNEAKDEPEADHNKIIKVGEECPLCREVKGFTPGWAKKENETRVREYLGNPRYKGEPK